MTDIEHQILQTLRSGPKSLSELFGILGATWTAAEIDRALEGISEKTRKAYIC